MLSYDFLLVLAIILLSTKMFGLVSKRVHMPAVVGALIAGVIIGPVLGLATETDFLAKSAELGVIMLMFLAGLDTDMEELKKTGMASLIIATIGVIVPLAGGALVYMLFFPAAVVDKQYILQCIFVGVVLTATSVSITVETLREMGKLKGRMGTAILGAAIIDDIIGIVILTVITSFKGESAGIGGIFVKIALYFVFLVAVGYGVHWGFKRVKGKMEEKRRWAIYAFAFCLLLSYVSERFFGIADITGAYFAGIILCNFATKEYIGKKINVTSYMFFAPIFFASIGIKTDLKGLTSELIVFSIVLLIVAIVTKIVGCGLGALMCKFPKHESLCIGIGMVSRGEVALIVAQKGAQAELLDPKLFPAIVMVVIVTTLITPIILKLAVSKNDPTAGMAQIETGHK